MLWVVRRSLAQTVSGSGLAFLLAFLAYPVLFLTTKGLLYGPEQLTFSRFTVALVSVTVYIYPAFASFVSMQALLPELSEGFISLVGMRSNIGAYLFTKYVVVSCVALGTFFTSSLLSFALAYTALPAAGLYPAVLGVPDSINIPFLNSPDNSYVVLGLSYSAWFALHGWIWSTFSFACMLLVRNRFVALLAPTVAFLTSWLMLSGLKLYSFTPYTSWILVNMPNPNFAEIMVTTGIEIVTAAALTVFSIRQYTRQGLAR